MNLTKWGKRFKVAPDEVNIAFSWLWSSFSDIWRNYKIIVEILTQQIYLVHCLPTPLYNKFTHPYPLFTLNSWFAIVTIETIRLAAVL